MKVLLVLLTVVAVVVSAARADVVHLKNGGKVVGTITELTLQIGPIRKTLSRDDIRHGKCGKQTWEVVAVDGTRYVGKVESVAVRCVAGALRFDGKSVRAIEFGKVTEPKPKDKPEDPALDQPKPKPPLGSEPEPPPSDPADPAAGARPPEERAKLAQLRKTAASLRDQYLERAKKIEAAEFAAFKKKYLAQYQAACDTVKQATDTYAKCATEGDVSGRRIDSGGLGVGIGRTTTITASGPAGEALTRLENARTKKRHLVFKIKNLREVLKQVARARRDRIRSYYGAITRDLTKGNVVSEKAMEKLYARALIILK